MVDGSTRGGAVDDGVDVRVRTLLAGRVPFVHAVVVRAEPPTSALPGDQAVVLADGTTEGFVGGQCARESVRTAAVAALADGESVLLRVLPPGAADFPVVPGATVAVNPCLSGGALEIFLHARVPAAMIHVVGETSNARAIADVARAAGLAVGVGPVADLAPGTVAVVEASHGGGEVESVRAALDAGIGFIGMIASARRGAAVLDAMDLTSEERARVHSPVGLPLGSVTPGEIALSVVAAVVAAVRTQGLLAPSQLDPLRAAPPRTAVDPICGMTVVVGPDTPHASRDGEDHWFCATGCRDAFLAGVG